MSNQTELLHKVFSHPVSHLMLRTPRLSNPACSDYVVNPILKPGLLESVEALDGVCDKRSDSHSLVLVVQEYYRVQCKVQYKVQHRVQCKLQYKVQSTWNISGLAHW